MSSSGTRVQVDQEKEQIKVDEEQYKAHILLKNLVDKTHKVDWTPELTVKDVRNALEGTLPENVKMIYEGKVLQDNQVISTLVPTPTIDSTPIIYLLHYPSISIDPIESAKDWDQKNRLRFFKGIHCLSVRLFEEAGKLLVDSLPTFTETAFISYNECVKYAMIAAMLDLPETCPEEACSLTRGDGSGRQVATVPRTVAFVLRVSVQGLL